MTDVPARGALTQMAMDAALPFDVSSEPFEFITSSLKRQDTHVRSQGIRGTRSREKPRVKIGQTLVSGTITMNPSVTELDLLIPRILGGTTAAGVTDVAETLPEFLIMVDKISKLYTYDGCRVARATLSGTAGSPIQLALDIEAETETEAAAGGFPVISIDTDTSFFIFRELVLTIFGTARKFSSFSLVIDNVLDAGRFNNSLTREEIAPMDRLVTLDVDLPFTSDNTDVVSPSIDGAAATLVMADGTDTYTFDFGNVKVEAQGVEVTGRDEIQAPLSIMSYKDGSASEIKITKT